MKIALFVFALTLLGPVKAKAQDTLSPGEAFQDCPSCPIMIVVGPGKYIRGDETGSKYSRPAHEVTIDYSFGLGKYEVTFDEWEACAAEKACKPDPSDHNWGRGTNPIINVSYADIQAYLKWLSDKTGETYRLPSEAEWEYAARAGTKTKYFWGDTPGKNNANCRKCGSEWSGHGSAPVGSFEPNPWGFHDMHGNAWEWVADCWHPDYKGAPKDGSARSDGNCKEPVTRSGSWYYFPKVSESSYRYKNHVEIFSYNISFRVLREIK